MDDTELTDEKIAYLEDRSRFDSSPRGPWTMDLIASWRGERVRASQLAAALKSAVWLMDGGKLAPEEEAEIRSLVEVTQ